MSRLRGLRSTLTFRLAASEYCASGERRRALLIRPRASLAIALVSGLLCGCKTDFATYTGTPRTPEFAAAIAVSPAGFRTAVCPPIECGAPAWRGYRAVADVDPTSAPHLEALARSFGAGYLGIQADEAELTIARPFHHRSSEVGRKSLLTGRGTRMIHSDLVARVQSRDGRKRTFVTIVYSTIDGSGKIYAATGDTQGEAVQNTSFRLTARL